MSEGKSLPVEPLDHFNYPIMLNLYRRLVVLVGAGAVGQRKLSRLLQVGARVRLIDPLVAASPHPSPLVESIARCFAPADLQDAVLVFACTDSALVNQQVADEARRRQLFCCRADQAQSGDFALPALHTSGSLTVAVSTGGGSPALAAQIRDRLAMQIPDSWGVSLEVVAAVRRKWLTERSDDKYNQAVLRSFWADRLLPLVEQGHWREIDQLLVETFGAAFSLEQLPLQLPEGML